MESTTPKIVGPYDGKAGFLGSIGVRFMIDGNEAGDRKWVMNPRPQIAKIAVALSKSAWVSLMTPSWYCSRTVHLPGVLILLARGKPFSSPVQMGENDAQVNRY